MRIFNFQIEHILYFRNNRTALTIFKIAKEDFDPEEGIIKQTENPNISRIEIMAINNLQKQGLINNELAKINSYVIKPETQNTLKNIIDTAYDDITSLDFTVSKEDKIIQKAKEITNNAITKTLNFIKETDIPNALNKSSAADTSMNQPLNSETFEGGFYDYEEHDFFSDDESSNDEDYNGEHPLGGGNFFIL